MSNPYAPKSQLKAKAPEQPTEVKEAITFDVPDGSVKEVLKWVGTDADKARAAYAVETEDKQRSSLLSQLKELF